MKKCIMKLISICLLFSLFACGCGKKSGTKKTSSEENNADKSSINVCIASEPKTIDPTLNDSSDGGTMIMHSFSGLAGYDADGQLMADCAKELVEGVENVDGTVTYTYTLKDNLKWSDGVDVKPSDFVYSWSRAVNPETGASYEYMFSIIKGYDSNQLDVVADDEARTLTVTLKNKCRYWNELIAFPTYMPIRQDIVEANGDAWATDPATYVTNGAYTLASWVHDSKLVFEKNPNYWNKDKITMDQVTFYLSDDLSNIYANFVNGTYSLIEDVPLDEMSNLKETSDEFYINGLLGTYYMYINENVDLLPNYNAAIDEKENAMQEIRHALALLIDRNYIVESVTQGGQAPASSFVGAGISDAEEGSDFSKNSGGNAFAGFWDTSKEAYESNVITAIDILKKYYTYDESTKKFTDFPSLTYSYNTLASHAAIAEYIQFCYSQYGITLSLENMEWAVYQSSVDEGTAQMGRMAWLADYDDPMTFLDMWICGSANNSAHIGEKGASCYSIDLSTYGYGVLSGTWADTYDKLIDIIKTTTDTNDYYGLCHMAENMLIDTGCICPIYFYTDPFMISNDYQGIVTSKLGFKLMHYSDKK